MKRLTDLFCLGEERNLLLCRLGMIIPVFLVLRTALDPLRKLELVRPLDLNIAALYGVVLGLFSFLFVVFKKKEEGLILEKTSKAFVFFLLVMFVIGIPVAYQNFGIPGLFCSIRAWVKSLVIFSVFLAFFSMSNLIDRDRVISLFFLSLVVPMVMGTHQIVASHKLFYGVRRIWGSFVHPNPFSFYLALFMGLTIWKIWRAQRGSRIVFWTLLLFWEATLLCFTWCKGGIVLALIVTGSTMFFMGSSRKKLICLAVIIFMAGLWVMSPMGRIRIQRALPHMENVKRVLKSYAETKDKVTSDQGNTMPLELINSSEWRLIQWKALLKRWRKKPLLGYGLGTSWKFVSPFHEQPHNDYIKFLVETGILGVAVWLILLAATTISLIKAKNHSSQSLLASVVLVFFIGWQVCAIFENMWDNTPLQLYLWALIGLLLGDKR